MITDLTNEAYLSAITVANISPKFLPTSWWQKSSGIDTEQSYVTVTLCIYTVSQKKTRHQTHAHNFPKC